MKKNQLSKITNNLKVFPENFSLGKTKDLKKTLIKIKRKLLKNKNLIIS